MRTYSEVSVRLEQAQRINRSLWNLEDICTEHICLIEIIGIFIVMYHVFHRPFHHTVTETHTNFRSRNFSILTKKPQYKNCSIYFSPSHSVCFMML